MEFFYGFITGFFGLILISWLAVKVTEVVKTLEVKKREKQLLDTQLNLTEKLKGIKQEVVKDLLDSVSEKPKDKKGKK
tara:strand:+ start:283 stop:516 length:234 start_codon:yes stop_codon:yes gene_type:complete